MKNINKYNISLSSNKSSPQRTTSQPREKGFNDFKQFKENMKTYTIFIHDKVRAGKTI